MISTDDIRQLYIRYVDLNARLHKRHVPDKETRRLATEVEELRKELVAVVPSLLARIEELEKLSTKSE